ncbi:MAG: hypothetical protein ACQEXQ_19960 [Bacillota bacterium]
MEKNRHEAVIHSEDQNVLNDDEAAISSMQDEQVEHEGQDGTHDKGERSPKERTLEVMENIGIKINSI